jgi:hypothetical protein
MNTTPKYKVIVHPTGKGRSKAWTWTQVARNGSPGAIAPRDYDSKTNAVRAGKRQVTALSWGFTLPQPQGSPVVSGPRVEGAVVDEVVLVVDESYRRP